MFLRTLSFTKAGDAWESEPLVCRGGDIRVRVHKRGPYPVDVLVSIDGEEEYIKYDDFGFDELKCEITVEGAMRGQHLKFATRSEPLLFKCLEM